MKWILEEHMDKTPPGPDLQGNTLIHWAAYNGHVDIVHYLMDITVKDKNPRNQDGETPLHWAAKNGHVEVVKVIMDKKGQVQNLHDMCGDFLSEYFLYYNSEDTTCKTWTWFHCSRLGLTPLHLAAQNGHLQVICALLEKCEDKNPRDLYSGETPLHYAAMYDHVDIVDEIMKVIDDKNPKDDNGVTPLHMAAQNGHVQVVQHILKTVEDKAPMDFNGDTPKDCAKKAKKHQIVKLLSDSSKCILL